MVAWGCAVWGTGLLLPALHPLRRLSDLLPALSTCTDMPRSITPGSGFMHVAPSPMVMRGCGVSASVLTPRGPSRGASVWGPYGGAAIGRSVHPTDWPMRRAGCHGPTAREAPRRPTARAPAPTVRPGKVQMSMATGAKHGATGEINGPRPHTRRTTRPGPRLGRRRLGGGGAALGRSGPAVPLVAGRTASGDLCGPRRQRLQERGRQLAECDNSGWNNVQTPRAQAQSQMSNRAWGHLGQLTTIGRREGKALRARSEFSGLRSRGAWGSGSFRPSGGGFRGWWPAVNDRGLLVSAFPTDQASG